MEKFLKYAVIFLLLICTVGTFVMPKNQTSSVFHIYIDGKLYKRINLKEVTSPYEISLPENTLLIEKDGISVKDALCPDKVCIKRGKMHGGAPIVCAPAHLYITSSESEVDAVAW